MSTSNSTSPSYRRRPVSRADLGPGLRRDDEDSSAAHFLTTLLDRVLYRDGLMLVIDKPAGIPVHSGPGGGPHLEHWFPLLRFGLPRSPALAHRLPRATPR